MPPHDNEAAACLLTYAVMQTGSSIAFDSDLHCCTRYPHIVEDVIEEEEQTVNGVEIPIDTSQPNPNQTEFDNLYLVCEQLCMSCLYSSCRQYKMLVDLQFASNLLFQQTMIYCFVHRI